MEQASAGTRGVLYARPLLGAVVLYFVGWDLWAVAADNRVNMSPDGFLLQTAWLAEALERGGSLAWLSDDVKGPLPGFLALPLLLVLQRLPLATRVLCVLAHGALMLQSHAMARRLGGGQTGGLWAALLCGVHPMIFGWARLDYREAVLAVVVMACLQAALVVKLERPWPALGLGCLLGLGLLTKLGFGVFMVGPGLWFLARRVRGRAALPALGALFLGAALVAGPWLLSRLPGIQENLRASTHTGLTPLGQAAAYLELPGSWPLLLAWALATAWLWVQRVERANLTAAGALVAGAFVLLCFFDYWSRYLVPIFPAAAAVVGAALGSLPRLRRPGRPWPRRTLAAGCAVCLLAAHLWLNLGGLGAGTREREQGAGMLAPDRGRYDGYPTALAALQPHGEGKLLVHDSDDAIHSVSGLEQMAAAWHYHGLRRDELDLAQADALLARGAPVPVLLIQRHPHLPPARSLARLLRRIQGSESPEHRDLARQLAWLLRRTWSAPLAREADDHGVTFAAYLVR